MALNVIAASIARSFRAKFLFSAFFAVILLPWLYYRSIQLTNSDVLWLCEALRRVFNGATMTQAAYEPNLPLGMLIYTIPVLAQLWLHIPLHYAVFVQSIFLIALSSYAVWAILRKWQLFSDSYVAVVTAGYVLINTYNVGLFIGERDHYIALGLIPFVLMQLSITYQLGLPKYFKWPAVILGTIAILIKPHHGLIPVLLLAQRLIKRRNLSVFRDADFLTLACGCILYALTIIIFFHDYLTTIFPDALHLYTANGSWVHVATGVLTSLICAIVLSIGILYTPAPKNETTLNLLLIILGLLSLIPFYVQGIGLYYQLIPALSFFGMAYAGALQNWFKKIIPHHEVSALCLLLIGIISIFHASLIPNFPTHYNHNSLNLPKILAEECPKDRECKFFMHNRNMAMIYETEYYTGIEHASRFPGFWFWPPLERKNPPLLNQEDHDRVYMRFSNMVAEDLINMKPDVLILIRNKDPQENFIPYFSKNKKFAKEIKRYHKIKTIDLNWGEYYRGLMSKTKIYKYDIYKRDVS